MCLSTCIHTHHPVAALLRQVECAEHRVDPGQRETHTQNQHHAEMKDEASSSSLGYTRSIFMTFSGLSVRWVSLEQYLGILFSHFNLFYVPVSWTIGAIAIKFDTDGSQTMDSKDFDFSPRAIIRSIFHFVQYLKFVTKYCKTNYISHQQHFEFSGKCLHANML